MGERGIADWVCSMGVLKYSWILGRLVGWGLCLNVDSGWWQPLNVLNVHPGCLGKWWKTWQRIFHVGWNHQLGFILVEVMKHAICLEQSRNSFLFSGCFTLFNVHMQPRLPTMTSLWCQSYSGTTRCAVHITFPWPNDLFRSSSFQAMRSDPGRTEHKFS